MLWSRTQPGASNPPALRIKDTRYGGGGVAEVDLWDSVWEVPGKGEGDEAASQHLPQGPRPHKGATERFLFLFLDPLVINSDVVDQPAPESCSSDMQSNFFFSYLREVLRYFMPLAESRTLFRTLWKPPESFRKTRLISLQLLQTIVNLPCT